MMQNASVETWLQQGHDQLDRGQYEVALETFQQAAALEPQNPQVLYALGLAYYRLERYQEVIAPLNQALQIQPSYTLALARRGMAYQELNQKEQARADFERAIQIQPQDYEGWRGRGIAFNELKRYEEAITDYTQAITLKPDFHYAYNNRGIALLDLGRYEEAIADYTQAIALKADDHIAYNNRDIVLKKLGRYEEAIADSTQAIALKADFHAAWDNLGWTYFNTNRSDEALKTWNDGLQQLQPPTPQNQEGRGDLYYSKGKFYYWYGQQQQFSPFENWLKAKASYEKALKCFEGERFFLKRLQVLRDLIQVSQYLMPSNKVEELWREGTDILDGWLQSPDLSLGRKIQLQRQFAGFNQMRVDALAHSGDPSQQQEALELAEQRKNTCLAWLKQNNTSSAPKLAYSRMQDLLNPRTAAIYWHISPAAITTFILKHNQPPLVLTLTSAPQPPQQRSQPLFGKPEQPYPANANQLRRFEAWMRQWKQNYQHYLQDSFTTASKEEAAWRQNMELILFNQLRSILEINRILEYLKDKEIDQLILIPHRDLHLLPLHVLFPGRFTITYLPSFQIGLNLQLVEQASRLPLGGDGNQDAYPIKLLNVENPRYDLPFATVEAITLSQLYPECRQLEVPSVTPQALIDALRDNTGFFHFTGHGYHKPEQPRESALVLAEPDKLTLGDIFDDEDLDLSQYELICLCACETGITSQDSILDEYVGLVSGFLAKGAGYVLSTLWTVDERSTALLVIEFYRSLKRGEAPAQALKQAQSWLHYVTYNDLAQWYRDLGSELKKYNPQPRNNALLSCIAYLETEAQIIETDPNKLESPGPPYAHPYHWASFILTGKPNSKPR
jgi:CHAT domain-containing protein/tetratricopeptide (TPR) repeat protein